MFKSMKRIIRWAGKYRGRLYLGSVFSFFSSLSTAIPTMAAAYALDKSIQAYWAHTTIDASLIWKMLWIIVGSIALNFLFSYLRAILQESIGYEVAAGQRIHLGDVLKRVPLGYFSQNSVGDILAGVTTELSTLELQGMKMVDVIINGYAKFIAIVLCLIFFSPVAAVISIVGVALSALALQGISRHSEKTAATFVAVLLTIPRKKDGVPMSGKLEQRIQSAHLTRTEKVIADYFLEHSGSLYFLTAKDIALALGVSDTSVIRLCRTLGYRGFRELQESLRSELSQVIEREKYVIPQHQVPDKLQKYQDLSSFQCLQFAVDCLQETYRKNDPEKHGQIVRILLESEHIFVSGFRGLAGPARHLGVLLSQYTRHVEYFCDADTRCVEKLLDYGPHDCVILLGAERYSRMTCVLAEMAHNAGCRLIVITDKLTAPFAGDADIVLLADLSSPTPTNSYIGVNFLIEVIAFEFSRTLGVYPQQRLSRLDAYLSELQLY